MHSPSPALPPVAFIGGGNMARALIGGMVRGGTPAASIHVSEPYAPNREGLAAEFGVAVTEDNAAAASKAAVWVLATNPQVLRGVCEALAPLAQAQRPLVVSIAAGITSTQLDRWLGGGLAVVRTYGASETAGGCVYDGAALDGVRVRIDEPSADGQGRIVVGGATLARGYRNPITPDPFAEPGWFRTEDIGRLDESGRLSVLGRLDDAISTGGLTVLPAQVEAVLAAHPAVAECAVFGVDDDRLGERVVAAVVAHGQAAPTLDELAEWVSGSLDRTAAPRELHVLAELPRRGIGKVDRRALRARYG